MPTSGERAAAAEILAKAKARVVRVRLVLDGELLAEHEELEARLAKAADSEALADRILEIEEAMRESEVEFVFRGIGRGQWRTLLADHPPSETEAAAGAEFDTNTFPFVAMAACLREPQLSQADLEALHEDTLSELQFSQLWAACLKANIGGSSTRPESQAARAIAGNGRPRSQQPSVSESAEAS